MSVRHRLLVAVALTSILVVSCVDNDEVALEPLSGHSGSTESPQEDVGAVGGIDASVSDDAVDSPAGRDIRLEDLPAGMYEDPPPGFGEVPLEELDLPPDEPPPPVEPVTAAPPQGSPPAPSPPPTNPPVPVPQGGAGGVAAVEDYCTLFEQYGSAMAAVGSALESGRPEQIAAALQRAGEVHHRAAEIGPASSRADHRDVASGLDALDVLFAEHGHDPARLLAAAETDPLVSERLAAASSRATDLAMERVNQQVLSSCGIALS